MKTLNIGLIDDKNYGIAQIINSIPQGIRYTFSYYPNTQDSSWKQYFDILFIDYYIDSDAILGTQIVSEIDASICIGFASDRRNSEKIISVFGDGYAIQKMRNTCTNVELNTLMPTIISGFFDFKRNS